MFTVNNIMTNLVGFILVIVACGVVSGAINWLPKRYEREEADFVREILGQHSAKGMNSSQVVSDEATPAAPSLFSILPPINLQSGLASLAVIMCAFWAGFLGLTWLSISAWFVFACGLIVLAGVDCKTKLLPDVLTLPLLWLGIVIQLFQETRTVGLELSVIGVLVGYLPLWLLAQVYRALRGRDGLGMGDLKLLAAMGAWSGPMVLPQVLLWAAMLAISFYVVERVMSRHEADLHAEKPFGPAIVAAYFLVLIFIY